jgi:acetyl-CoA synthetase
MAHPDRFPVPENNQVQTHADHARYEQLYQKSIQEPEAFWRVHGQRISWFKPYHKVKNTSFEPSNVSIRWYEDGELNACYNCLDRHLPGKAHEPAYFWKGDSPGSTAVITYGQLHNQVCRLANGLRSLGITEGSRGTIYFICQ